MPDAGYGWRILALDRSIEDYDDIIAEADTGQIRDPSPREQRLLIENRVAAIADRLAEMKAIERERTIRSSRCRTSPGGCVMRTDPMDEPDMSADEADGQRIHCPVCGDCPVEEFWYAQDVSEYYSLSEGRRGGIIARRDEVGDSTPVNERVYHGTCDTEIVPVPPLSFDEDLPALLAVGDSF